MACLTDRYAMMATHVRFTIRVYAELNRTHEKHMTPAFAKNVAEML